MLQIGNNNNSTENNNHSPSTEVEQQHLNEENFIEKHPLENSWTLWWHSPNSKINERNYASFFTEVYSFQDVETFWSVFNHIRGPSQIASGTTYYLLKEGIKPEWEDPRCINGGEWVFTLSNRKDGKTIDNYWLELVMFSIGESFTYSDHLVGICAANRKSNLRINIWLDTIDEEVVKTFGQQFKFEVLKLQEFIKVEFKSFKDQLEGKKTVLHTV
ncbi:hypothetical protein ABK040_013958 [Willaertia magna]